MVEISTRKSFRHAYAFCCGTNLVQSSSDVTRQLTATYEIKAGAFVMSAEVGAVAAGEGVCLTAKYRKGVLVVVVPKKGLMATITIGEQKFSYKSLN